MSNNTKINTVLFFLFPILILSQNNPLFDDLVDRLHSKTVNSTTETIYLQTSKGIYETGEDLWFKGYVLNSQHLSPSTQSKTLYVQLIENKTDKTVWQEKYEIENGFVDGHIYVQDSLQNGSYTLSAYTPHSFYDDKQPIKSIRRLEIVKNITNYHQTKKDSILIEEGKEQKIDFQLFPEGGHLVSGIDNKIAFKSVDTKGNPKAISGTLYENDKPIKTFTSVHTGMGSFVFIPNNNSRYHIALDSTQTKKQYTLPNIKPKGFVLQLLNNTKDALILKVSKNTDQNKETVYIRVQIRGVVYSIAKAVIEKERIVKTPLNDVPQGIVEVTLFDQNLKPLAERLVYVNQDKRLHIKTILDKGEYYTRSNVKLKLKVTDQNNNPIIAHLGMSVFDNYYDNPKDSKTIENHYHLSTQLKGRFYNPNYYFNPQNKNRKQALDLLLLTQGWRAYEWTEANLDKKPLNKRPIINDTITGKLYARNKKAQNVLSNQYVMSFTADKQSDKTLIEVDSIGRFTVFPEYIQTAKRGYLYLKLLLNDPKNKIDITINDPSFATINRLRKQKALSCYPKPQKLKPQIKQGLRPFTLANDVNKLEEVIVTGKKKRIFRDKYMGTLDSLAKLDMNTDYVCVSKILNCEVHQNHSRNTKPIEGESYQKYIGFKWNSDRTAFTVQRKLTFTYQYPVLTEEELLKKFNLASIKGYYGKRIYYVPVYDKTEQTDEFPDYRNTLFWKPDIITNEKGEIEIEFSTSDINSKFIGIIEGVSGEGQLGRQIFEFNVKKKQ